MALYVAYGLVVMHVALGIMQGEPTPAHSADADRRASAASRVLHIVAGWRERAGDRGDALERRRLDRGRAAVCRSPTSARASSRRRAASASRCSATATQIGALTNLCAHQNGPIGEGRIIDGCVTCPWHGYQYRLADGCAPPPFTEKLATYRVRIKRGVRRGRPAAAAARHAGGDHKSALPVGSPPRCIVSGRGLPFLVEQAKSHGRASWPRSCRHARGATTKSPIWRGGRTRRSRTVSAS